MSQPRPKHTVDLDQLAAAYRIIGELVSGDDQRLLIGRRLRDDRNVMIVVTPAPEGDKGNALGHLAADARLLQSASHPNVLTVLDGQWLGTEAYATVVERPGAHTLEELLARRDETFAFPRIAAILRQVNGALAWARSAGVVHRAVGADAVFVEPGSDMVRLLLRARRLTAEGTPDAAADAATIAALARAMLTRSVGDPARDRRPLGEVRPGLPKRVIEQTELILSGAPADGREVDPTEYIAGIAMAEELKYGEAECERLISEMTEEQRLTRDALAAERTAHEADLAEQARKFAQEKEQTQRAFAREREELHKAIAKEREELRRAVAKERSELEREIARERAQLDKERAALERDVARERSATRKERATPLPSAAKARPWWKRYTEDPMRRRFLVAGAGLVGIVLVASLAIGRDREPQPVPPVVRDSAAGVVEPILIQHRMATTAVDSVPVAPEPTPPGPASTRTNREPAQPEWTPSTMFVDPASLASEPAAQPLPGSAQQQRTDTIPVMRPDTTVIMPLMPPTAPVVPPIAPVTQPITQPVPFPSDTGIPVLPAPLPVPVDTSRAAPNGAAA